MGNCALRTKSKRCWFEEVRRLGREAMERWAVQAEERTAREFCGHPSAGFGTKKNVLSWLVPLR